MRGQPQQEGQQHAPAPARVGALSPGAGDSAPSKAAAVGGEGAAVGEGVAAGVGAKGPKLVVRMEAAEAMLEQAKALFKVEDQVQVGPGASLVPLALRMGGFIGGPDTLSNPWGNAVLRAAAVGSDQPSQLCIASDGHNCVRVFDAISGASIRQIATGQNPRCLTLCSPDSPGSGRPAILYVAEAGDNRIQALEPDTGTHVRFFGKGTAGAAANQSAVGCDTSQASSRIRSANAAVCGRQR